MPKTDLWVILFKEEALTPGLGFLGLTPCPRKCWVNVCSAVGLQNTQTARSDCFHCTRAGLVITLVSASESRSVLGLQQVAYLTKANFWNYVRYSWTTNGFNAAIAVQSTSSTFTASPALTDPVVVG